MTELLTAAQMRAIEQAAIDSGEVTGLELMERAGQGVVDAIFEEWPELARLDAADRGPAPSPLSLGPMAQQWRPPEYLGQDDSGHRAVVLCGPGNNGGDGFVVARLLKERGWDVEVFLYGDADKLPPDARVNYERWGEIGEVELIGGELISSQYQRAINSALIVDALFGIGLKRALICNRPVPDIFHHLMEDSYFIDGEVSPPYVVAVDVVSGLDADSGRMLDPTSEEETGLDGHLSDTADDFGAHLTITFHRPKIGHLLGEGPARSGKVKVVDIGLASQESDQAFRPLSDDVVQHIRSARNFERGWWAPSVGKNVFGPREGQHKYSHGHALILSGGVGKGGAARLTARGALRIGAGAVTLGCPPAALIENAAQLDAIMLSAVKDAEALLEVLEDTRINALCLGPGLGLGERESALVGTVLSQPSPGLDPGPQTSGRGPGSSPGRRSIVLDADALTLLSRDDYLFTKLHKNCILTPHAGEFARLFPDIAEKLNAPAINGPAYSKVDATREAAKRAGCIILFKGPDTVIADPSGRCSINASVHDRAAPWLATAGSGDVLAGFITGLLARGFAPMQAAETGAWLHTECALSFGPGLIAEDLPEELPKVFRALGL